MGSPPPSLPRSLEAWSEPLSLLREELVAEVGLWLPRLAALVGPLRAREQEQPGGATVAGLSGLSRHGLYERLLMSEWSLAEAAPLEFLRRAADREHLFLALERHQPADTQRCLLLLDAGPEQLGAPRLAHIAALIVLARRAAVARSPLRWGVLQQPPPTPASPRHLLSTRADAAGLEHLLAQRALRPVTPRDVSAWLSHLEAPRPGDEVWLIGGSEAIGLAPRGAHTLEIEDAPRSDGALTVQLRRGSSGQRQRLELPLPSGPSQRLLLTRPLRPAPASATPQATPVLRLGQLQPDLRFTLSGQRLLARDQEGRPVVLRVPKQDDQPIRRERIEATLPGALVGQGWYRGPLLLFWQSEPNRLRLHGAVPSSLVSGCTDAYFDLLAASPVDLFITRRGRLPPTLRFIDRRGRLFSFDFGTQETTLLREKALGLWARDGRCVMLSRERSRVVLRLENPHGDDSTHLLPHDDDDNSIDEEGGGAFYSQRGPNFVGTLVFSQGRGRWRGLGKDERIEVSPDATVLGVTWQPDARHPGNPGGTMLLVRSAAWHSLSWRSMDREQVLPTGGSRIVSATVSLDGQQVAWLTEDQEVVLWNVAAQTVRARLRLVSASEQGGGEAP